MKTEMRQKDMLSEPQYIWDNGKKIWMISTKKKIKNQMTHGIMRET